MVVGAPGPHSGHYEHDDAAGAAFVFHRNRQGTPADTSDDTWELQARLIGSDTTLRNEFGTSVAISGDTIVVGSPGGEYSGTYGEYGDWDGSAYVFRRSGSTWTEQQKLTPGDDMYYYTEFGYSVAISCDTIFVGGSDEVVVFRWSGSTWTESQRPAHVGVGGFVAISGETAIVGPYVSDPDSGVWEPALVLQLSGNSWIPQGALPWPADMTGSMSAAIDGDTIVLGSPDDADGTGAAYVFQRSGASWSHQDTLVASDGAADDRFGTSLAVSGDTILVGAPHDYYVGDPKYQTVGWGSAYVFRRSGDAWPQEQKLTASDAWLGDQFGTSVAISGDTAFVGAPLDDDGGTDSGSVSVFDVSGGLWTQLEKLDRGTPRIVEDPRYGVDVIAIDGEYMLLWASTSGVGRLEDDTAVIVFRRNQQGTPYQGDDTWEFDAILTVDDLAGVSDGFSFEFGFSAAISGDTIVVSSLDRSRSSDMEYNAGAVYVFQHSGGTWVQQQRLHASNWWAGFGKSVAIDGDTMVVGGCYWSSYLSGSAYVFHRDDGVWTEVQRLTAHDASPRDEFGDSLAISGDTLVVGASSQYGGADAAYVFQRSGSTWSEQQKLTASDPAQPTGFGRSVAISGDTVVVGAPLRAGDNDSGAAYVFQDSGDTWVREQKLAGPDTDYYDNEGGFGEWVAISGDRIVVGYPEENLLDGTGQEIEDAGSAYVFQHSGGRWVLQQKLTPSDAAEYEWFGASGAISGDWIALYRYGSVPGRFGHEEEDVDSVRVFGPASPPLVGFASLATENIEGDSGTTAFTFAINRTGDLTATTTLTYAVTGSGTDPADAADFGGTLPSGTVTFQPGETSATITVLVTGDVLKEPDESFTVTLSDPAGNAQITSASATGTIRNDDVSFHFQDILLAFAPLQAGDLSGYSVAVDGDLAVIGVPCQDPAATGAGTAQVFQRNPQGTPGDHSDDLWEWQATLAASDGSAGDQFGYAVSISGDWIAVGAPQDDDSGQDAGSAYLFQRSGRIWNQQQKLTASDAAEDDRFGTSVAISGDRVIVGAPHDDDAGSDSGSAYVFQHQGSLWSEIQRLTASDAWEGGQFGASLATSGDTIVVGAADNYYAWGLAYVFQHSGSTWAETQKLAASDGSYGDRFGSSLTIAGDVLVVGSPWADLSDLSGNTVIDAGSAYAFWHNDQGTPDDQTDDVWELQVKLTASDAAEGDRFGSALAISGDTLVVGSPADDLTDASGETVIDAGSAYVFRHGGSTWTESQKLTAGGAVAGDQFGYAVAISGDTIVAGLPWADLSDGSGNELTDAGLGCVFGPAPSSILSLAARDARKAEGGSGTTPFTFTVRRLGDLSGTTTVRYAVTGSGTNPAEAADFGDVLPYGTVTFQPDETSQTITVSVSGDSAVEADQGFTVRLSNPSNNARLATASASGTIWNDDTTTLSITDVTAPEGSGGTTGTAFRFEVVLSNAVQGGLLLPFVILDGTATAADDFTVMTVSPLIFSGAAGETQTITVLVNADRKVEADEQFQVQLGTVGPLRTGILAESIAVSRNSATGTILNDDLPNHPPVLNQPIADQAAVEGRAFHFTFSAETFQDPDAGDSLTFAATLTDGKPLPAWLTFTGSTRTFEGTPQWGDRGSLDVLVTATDQGGLSADTRFAITVAPDPHRWQNPRHPCDVNADGSITPIDVLLLINDINGRGSRELTTPSTPTPPPFLDPNGDGWITPLDVLIVINYINAHGSGPIPSEPGGEGEYDSPIDRDEDAIAVSSHMLGFGSHISGSVVVSTWPSRGPQAVWPASLQSASRTTSTVTRARAVADKLLDRELETSDLEDAITAIASEVARTWDVPRRQ